MTLKNALETLLGAPCHHMAEVFSRTEIDPPAFLSATRGDLPDWEELLGGYAAAVDWPASAFYAELAEAYPDAIVVLSRRDSFETWWKSANNTIFKHFGTDDAGAQFGGADWPAMIDGLWKKTFGDADRSEPEAVKAAYDRYHERVRESVPAERLVEFETGAGWEPLCAALGLPIPETPFPHLNSTADFNSQTVEDIQAELDEAGKA
jgi:hypothetical protein